MYRSLKAPFRAFTLFYRDNKKNFYKRETYMAGDIGKEDAEITAELIEMVGELEARDYTVCFIIEALNGYSYEELDKMLDRDPSEAMKHLKLMYLESDAVKAQNDGDWRFFRYL